MEEQKKAIWIGPPGNNTLVGNVHVGKELNLIDEVYAILLWEKLIKPLEDKAKFVRKKKEEIKGGD